MNQTTTSPTTLNAQHLPNHGWIRIHTSDHAALVALQRDHQLSLKQAASHPVEESGFILLSVTLPPADASLGSDCSGRSAQLRIAFNAELIITVEPDEQIPALDSALKHVLQLPETAPPSEALLVILEALGDALQETVAQISRVLADLAIEAVDSSGGFKVDGRQVGVADIAQTAVSLGEAEELIARTIEGQLMLERAARWVRRSGAAFADGQATLLSDIQGARRHARFQHAKVRNIQQSLMTTLDLKQNQIIKVFTVVTAVFTPPTLIAAYYGQNFAHMPELSLSWGEWFVMGTTAFFALVPLAYIKRKGWLR